jgi:cyclase
MTNIRTAATALLLACALPVAAQDFSKIEIKTTKLNDTTWMLTGAGGNLGLSVGPDAVFLIDDQYAPMTPKITAAIKAITDKPVKFVVNTHWHGDHTGGNENFGKAGAIIVAHDNVRKRMSTEQVIHFFNSKVPPSPKEALPVITFGVDTTFHLNGDEIQALHTPKAHTDGDAIVFFKKSNILHMGDIYFNGLYPFIDGGSGGTVDGVIAAVDRALAFTNDDTKVIPGHGPLATKADLKAYRDMLATVAGRIKAQIAAGKKLEEIVAAKPTADYDAKWGNGFIKPDKWVELVVRNLLP